LIFLDSWWWNRRFKGIQNAYDAGADLVVIGTAFENNIHLKIVIDNQRKKYDRFFL
jgi:hypothetical protein